ncbi:hypothetical protein CRUP_023491 [Coryphaenoides rupestris]|nr:hypothetical protein CRUP_023491 [Coryphaenoides rupestris]
MRLACDDLQLQGTFVKVKSKVNELTAETSKLHKEIDNFNQRTLSTCSYEKELKALLERSRIYKVYCKVIHFFHMYMLGCNYFWMLCEGIYLHTLIVVAVQQLLLVMEGEEEEEEEEQEEEEEEWISKQTL